MKIGDKVWVWNAWGEKKHQIEQGILVSFTPGCVDAWVQMQQFRERPYHFLLDEVFPTREALCEHYRKIFDNKIDLPRKARVINEERLLYGEVVNIFKSRLMFLDEDNELYEKEELRFL